MEKTVSKDGRLRHSVSRTGTETSYLYDSLGRRTHVTDSRTNAPAVTAYNSKGQIMSVTDPSERRTVHFTYHPDTGRKTEERVQGGSGENFVTRYAYNERGQVTHIWGNAACPVQYGYDGYGRLQHMCTYRDGTGWDAARWPGNAVCTDRTEWTYDPGTGFLTAKKDAKNKSVTYGYTPWGKLETRTWARENGTLVTTYTYDPKTGELLETDYSDATPDIGLTYDRLGRQKTVTDAVGTRTSEYDTDTLELSSVSIAQNVSFSASGLYSRTVTRKYDTYGRPGGFSMGTAYDVTYGYEPGTGRFRSLSHDIAGSQRTTTYYYVPKSDLIGRVESSNGIKNEIVTAYAYEPKRSLKTRVRNEYPDTADPLISQYDYTYDDIGRRTHVTNTGSAFPQNAFTRYDYNSRSELTGSRRYLGTDITETGMPVDPETRIYSYDYIGNRKTATEHTLLRAYSVNSLNQYDQIITGTQPDIPKYDEDGNMTAYAGRKHTYNAENRLTAVEPENPAAGDIKTEFVYDYMGRRVKKTISVWNGSWTSETEKLFIYDGWNMICEITIPAGQPATEKYYVWGPDLSQSLQGAGGIGGLVATLDKQTGNVYYYLYDANGNVGQLVNAENGSIAARYEYDPYGNEIVADGSEAVNNVYRWSTKYFDAETGLVYYGFRYYLPNLGRWNKRDPMEEAGGLNLYGFIINSPIDLTDILGMSGLWDSYYYFYPEKRAEEYRRKQRLRNKKIEAMLVFDISVAMSANARWDSAVRKSYGLAEERLKAGIKQLVDDGIYSAEEGARKYVLKRNMLVESYRKITTPAGHSIAQWLKPVENFPDYDQLIAKKGSPEAILERAKTRKSVNKGAKITGKIGGVCSVIFVSVALYDISVSENKPKTISKHAGGAIGAASGGWATGKILGAIGSVGGPELGAVGLGMGYVIGSIIGAGVGSETAEELYDAYVED